jgi:hypothetical protein
LTSGKIDASDSPKDFWIDHVVMNDWIGKKCVNISTCQKIKVTQVCDLRVVWRYICQIELDNL